MYKIFLRVDFGAICSADMQMIRYSLIQVGRQLGKNVLALVFSHMSYKKVIVTIRNSMINLFLNSYFCVWERLCAPSLSLLVGEFFFFFF